VRNIPSCSRQSARQAQNFQFARVSGVAGRSVNGSVPWLSVLASIRITDAAVDSASSGGAGDARRADHFETVRSENRRRESGADDRRFANHQHPGFARRTYVSDAGAAGFGVKLCARQPSTRTSVRCPPRKHDDGQFFARPIRAGRSGCRPVSPTGWVLISTITSRRDAAFFGRAFGSTARIMTPVR